MSTLFLDRDGVINVKRDNDYVKTWDEFQFRDDFLAATSQLALLFPTIILLTNQRGVGRGLMTETDLHYIHARMMSTIQAQSGRIDALYYCPSNSDTHPNRKPRVGMALQAKFDFPHIRFSDSYFVGDSSIDMLMGAQLGMTTLYLNSEPHEESLPVSASFSDWNEILSYFLSIRI